MPTPDIQSGDPCWIDLMTSDAEQAKSFYGELFDWTFETGDQEMYGGYISAAKNGKAVAGIMAKQEDQAAMPDAWTTYLAAEDAAATAKTVAETPCEGLPRSGQVLPGCFRLGDGGHE